MQIDAMRQAASQGDPEALCGLVLLALAEADGPMDAASSIELLMQAARSGFAPALRCLGLAAARTADIGAARQWFALAWSHGDPVSVALLASVCEDADERVRLHALAASVGVKRSAARTQPGSKLAMISVPIQLPAAPDPSCFDVGDVACVVYRQQPRLFTHDDVFSELECEYIIALADPLLAPSFINDPVSGRPLRHPNRTSHSMAFPGHDGDLWLRQLQRRLAHLADVPFMHSERLAVLRYGIGEEYRPHRDYLHVGTAQGDPGDRLDQRITTAFCYLNDVEVGGETDFPLLNSRAIPKRGRVVMFDNVNADGSPDPSTLHAGLPVQRGEKWLATMWFRQGRFREF